MQKACNFGHRYENTNSNTDVTIHEQVAAPLHTDGNKTLHSYGLERRDLKRKSFCARAEWWVDGGNRTRYVGLLH